MRGAMGRVITVAPSVSKTRAATPTGMIRSEPMVWRAEMAPSRLESSTSTTEMARSAFSTSGSAAITGLASTSMVALAARARAGPAREGDGRRARVARAAVQDDHAPMTPVSVGVASAPVPSPPTRVTAGISLRP